MVENKSFQYIKHPNIDSEKWNRCVDMAPNSRIYANDWHLNRTAQTWDALVWGDYEYVMPLPYRKKLGIKYLYQPLYSQQLGIFPTPPKSVAEAFYDFLVSQFRFSDVHLNAENFPVKNDNKLDFLPRHNYLLPLNHDYTTISQAFSKNTKRNIAKANKHHLSLIKGISLEEYLRLKEKYLPASMGEKELAELKNLIAYGLYKGVGKIYGVYSTHNELCAAVYFCRWKERVIYFNAASSEEGKETRSMFFLIQKFIEENAGKNLILDFEGSMIPGVARFYDGFGASPETYFQLKFNRLPLPLRWFKR